MICTLCAGEMKITSTIRQYSLPQKRKRGRRGKSLKLFQRTEQSEYCPVCRKRGLAESTDRSNSVVWTRYMTRNPLFYISVFGGASIGETCNPLFAPRRKR